MTDPLRMPGRLRTALAFVFLQILLNGAFGVLMQVEMNREADHGQDPVAALQIATYISYVTVVAMLAAAVAIILGHGWGRLVLIAFEALSAVSGLITLVSGSPQALIGIVLAALVVATLLNKEVLAWFEAKKRARDGQPGAQAPRIS
ncbi:hypothetical protein [Amycolatopsis benzoatilytica]|uniref:hypothetical protein n=1 Tax=Amycolatopsis benzoatilytica TaxID=346045 RepID=UPI00035CCAD6|nr:hypothetical protein [Amycolatopsis benzoatilytica]